MEIPRVRVESALEHMQLVPLACSIQISTMCKLPLLAAILVWSTPVLSAADLAPALQWVKTLSGSGASSVTGAAADAAGHLYIVGNTTSLDFPVSAAAQSKAGGSPLVRIDSATGKVDKLYPPGLSSVTVLTADPRNSRTLYAGAGSAIFQSLDAGATWALLSTISPATAVRAITVDPSNSSTLYAATTTQGIQKSIDGGLNWKAINNGIAPFSDGTISGINVWVDPRAPQVVFAFVNNGLLRSADGGTSWAPVINLSFFTGALAFDSRSAGTLYLGTGLGVAKSTDDGQTVTPLAALPEQPPVNALLVDPQHAGTLFAGSFSGLFVSTDSGVTWTRKSSAPTGLLVADPGSNAIYTNAPIYGIVKSTDGFNTSTPIGPPATSLRQIVVAGSNVFEVTSLSNDVFVAKLDADGNLVYATYFGGSSDDTASAMTLGTDGSVYVAGATQSPDLPTTPGAYARSMPGTPGGAPSFLFKLSPDGSLAWSTYFAVSGNPIKAIATDSAGNVYVGGSSVGKLPTTPGAYQTQFEQTFFCTGFIGCFPGPTAAFATKFNAQGTGLVFSTYVPTDNHKNQVTVASAMQVDTKGNVWFGGQGNVVELNNDGAALIASTMQTGIAISALALDSSSNLYAAGAYTPAYSGLSTPGYTFPATPGAFQPASQPAIPVLPSELPPGGFADAFVIKWDSTLSHILAATLLGGESADMAESMTLDRAGNVLISGETDSKAFPTHAPFQASFSSRAGFVAALDPSLSHLLFSTYLGDGRPFDARAAVLDGDGNLLLAGSTLSAGGLFIGGDPGQSFTAPTLVVANKIALPAAPALRLDSVTNYASRIAAPIAPGEPILATGAGFGSDAQFIIDGAPLPGVTGTASTLVAVMPDDAKTSGTHSIQISSGGALSNPVYVPAAPASPGIYTVDGSGFGQGYILNSDGTMNSAANPAAPGSPITIFAAGQGAFTLDNGYAVTALPPSVYVDGFYANGISAVIGPAAGLPGNVYQLKVYVPNPADLVKNNPDLKNFKFPPQVGVKLVMGPVHSLNPDNSTLLSQGGVVINLR